MPRQSRNTVRRARAAIGSAALAVALGLGACGEKDEPDLSTVPEPTETTVTVPTATTPTTPATPTETTPAKPEDPQQP